jgi:predicted nucleic acid-binding protein
MLLVFDTSALIEIDKGNNAVLERVRDLAEKLPLVDLAVPWPSCFEFYTGMLRESPEKKEACLMWLRKFTWLGMNFEATRLFTEMRSKLVQRVGDFDLLIAAIAISSGGLLLTGDRDFLEVPGLNVEIVGSTVR